MTLSTHSTLTADAAGGAKVAMLSQADWIWSRNQGPDQALLAADRERSIRGTSTDPCLLAVDKASGIWVFDHAGRRYTDFYGNNCHHIGHQHPRLIAALKEQLDGLVFVARGMTNGPAVEFAKALSQAWGAPDAKVVAARSGADAIEIALSIARANTGRYKTLSFYGSYHGRSAGALSVGGRHEDRAGLGPLLPGALHVPPYYRHGDASLGEDDEAYAGQSIDMMRTAFAYEPDIGAVIGETIRNGPYCPPDWYWPEVRQLCDRYGALLILDEVATGLGKTGSLFNHERFGVRPDLLVVGKALGGTAMPLSAVLVAGRLDSAPQLNMGYFTHEKNPLCARAGLTTLAILRDEDLVGNARAMGAIAAERLDSMERRHASIRAVRCAGLMVAVEFSEECGSGQSGQAVAQEVQRRCIERGVLPTLPRGASLTFSSALTIGEHDLNDALDVLDEAIASCG
jgi:4-aminobutyrate aminotransferase